MDGHGRIIIESAKGADIMELKLPEALFEEISYITVIRGRDVYRMSLQGRPNIAQHTPPPDMIHIPSPATPPEDREGWTCPNTECASRLDVAKDVCGWCQTPRPSAG